MEAQNTESTRPGSYSVAPSRGPSLVMRVIYFILIGWWFGGIVSTIAWILVVTVLFLPIGLWLINRLPTIITLRPQGQSWHLEGEVLRQGSEQRSFLLRALYFIFIGWWFSGVWMAVAYLALVTIVGIPLSFWMYGRVGAVTTLFRS